MAHLDQELQDLTAAQQADQEDPTQYAATQVVERQVQINSTQAELMDKERELQEAMEQEQEMRRVFEEKK